MRIGTAIFFVGFLLVLLPYLGIPGIWKQYGTVGCGVLLLVLGYIVRRQQYLREQTKGGERTTDTFVETTPELFS